MSKAPINFKLFIQFFFFKIVTMWTKSVQYAIGCLWQWSAERHNRVLEQPQKLLVESKRKEEIDSFVKNMQRQAKITGSRPKKDLDK